MLNVMAFITICRRLPDCAAAPSLHRPSPSGLLASLIIHVMHC